MIERRCLVVLLATLICGGAPLVEAQVAFVGATVVPMNSPDVLDDATVLVQGDRITWFGPSAEADLPPETQRIDASGLFLLPGLSDMHVHTEVPEFPLFLANGVTTIREMNGSLEHLAWQREIAAQTRLGPTMYVAGTLLSGVEQQWRHVLITTPEEASTTAVGQLEAGYDFLKAYSGLSPGSYMAIVDAAASANVPVVGHIPEAVGLERVLDQEQYGIEHIEQLLNAAGGHEADTSAFARMAADIARAGTWVTPTLAVMEVLALIVTPEVQRRFELGEMQYVSAGTWGWWETLRRNPSTSGPRVERARAFFGLHQSLARALVDAGVNIVAGTDSPNPLMVPGFAMHEELRTYVELGMTPYEALRTATVNAARLVNAEDEFGVVAAGARADLVLVRGNPLESLDGLRRPVGVMVRGRWLPAAELERMLEPIKRDDGAR